MTDVSTKKLDEWIKERASSRRDRNVVAFLAVRDEVQAGLDAGHAATTLFAYLRDGGRVSFCYDTFLKYVHRYLRTPKKPLPLAIPKTQAPPRAVGNGGRPVKPTNVPPEMPGFHWNPHLKPEDLL